MEVNAKNLFLKNFSNLDSLLLQSHHGVEEVAQKINLNQPIQIQPVSYKRYFWCNNCFLLLVYTIHLSLSTNLVDPPPMGTFYMKHPLF